VPKRTWMTSLALLYIWRTAGTLPINDSKEPSARRPQGHWRDCEEGGGVDEGGGFQRREDTQGRGDITPAGVISVLSFWLSMNPTSFAFAISAFTSLGKQDPP
jgi:hypothetical protein